MFANENNSYGKKERKKGGKKTFLLAIHSLQMLKLNTYIITIQYDKKEKNNEEYIDRNKKE